MRLPYPVFHWSRLRVLACSLWLLLWLPAAVWAGGFALQINDSSGLDEPWPLIAGLPFPEGELHDAAQIRILDATGAQVPAQMDVAATWRDGSLRWVLAGFTANPQGSYRVSYDEVASPANAGLTVNQHSGGITINTGVASYEFGNTGLLPNTGQMGGVTFLSNAKDGAYLVDNLGRLGRVSGNVKSTILKQGHSRVVLFREGTYVTSDGVALARAEAWFYFAADVPYVKVTHSLIFTHDTNHLWVRDYGLEFKTPTSPTEATFAFGGESQTGNALLSMQPVNASERQTVSVGSNEVFMLQDDFPRFLERKSLAVIGNSRPLNLGGGGSFSNYTTTRSAGATGDWADGKFGNYGLTVAMPWLAQRFPKDITFGPSGVRAALWSGRSGRELDFRTNTLISQYWGSWVNYSPDGTNLTNVPSNAQGSARTHDVWLLPRVGAVDQNVLEARAKAASQAPLVLADPVWLTETEAIGWPTHPVDSENFPIEETILSNYWDSLMTRYEALRRTGFIAWGDPPHIRHATESWFRVNGQIDYNFRRHAWNLYARSGDRRYYDYATRFNRFYSDLSMSHEDTATKRKGETTAGETWAEFTDRPLYWGTRSQLQPFGGNHGHDIGNLLLDYYLTGDEQAFKITEMHGDAFKAGWARLYDGRRWFDGPSVVLRMVANLYAREWDSDFGNMAEAMAEFLIDLGSPNGINDEIAYGSLYKADRELYNLYFYFHETGDERARDAFLRGIDFKYRFNRIGSGITAIGEDYPSFLFAIAYRWTGNPNYLRVLHAALDQYRRWNGVAMVYWQSNPTMGVPTTLGVLAKAPQPVTAFPIVRQYSAPTSKVMFRKLDNQVVDIRAHVRMLDTEDSTSVLVYRADDPDQAPVDGLTFQSETMFTSSWPAYSDLRRRSATLMVPAQEPAGLYVLEFPGAEFVDVLETSSPQVFVHAPDGHLAQVEKVDHFWVPEGTTTLQLHLSAPTQIRRPDGSVALVANSSNIGTRNIPVGDHTGVWSLVPALPGTVRLLNVEPIFSREPQYVIPWSDVPLAGSDGSFDGSDGSLAGPDGSLAGSDGSLDGSDGSLDGADGSADGSDGSLDGSDGFTAGSDGSPDGSDSSPEGSDAPPNAPELEVSLLRKDMRPWSE